MQRKHYHLFPESFPFSLPESSADVARNVSDVVDPALSLSQQMPFLTYQIVSKVFLCARQWFCCWELSSHAGERNSFSFHPGVHRLMLSGLTSQGDDNLRRKMAPPGWLGSEAFTGSIWDGHDMEITFRWYVSCFPPTWASRTGEGQSRSF